MSIQKNTLALQLAGDQNLSKKQASQIIDSLVDIIKDHLQAGERVAIRNFGTLYVRHTPERNVNPEFGNGKAPAANRARFRTSPALKARLNQ